MPAEELDQLYHERFDQIDANHDGQLDPQERALGARNSGNTIGNKQQSAPAPPANGSKRASSPRDVSAALAYRRFFRHHGMTFSRRSNCARMSYHRF